MGKKAFNLIIVDERGSMYAIREQAFTGMSETKQSTRNYAEQKPDLEQYVSLRTFNSDYTNFITTIPKTQQLCLSRRTTTDWEPARRSMMSLVSQR